jgi:hypothetical protein
LWTDKTYKYDNKKINLSSRLNGSASQTITITLTELELPYFDGVYFIEALSDTEEAVAITADLTRYEECILDRVMEKGDCVPCQEVEDPALTNTQAMLDGLYIAIKHGFIQEILTLVKGLDRQCSDECKSCGTYNHVTSNNYFTFNIVS